MANQPPHTGSVEQSVQMIEAPTSRFSDSTHGLLQQWDTEMQLVSALSKLQELDTRIHQLRTLLPNRLLAPIVPLLQLQPQAGKLTSPHELGERLKNSARNCVAEVASFEAMWRSPETKAVWDHVTELIKANDGQLLQPTGVWERDYDAILEELINDERQKREQRLKDEEAAERATFEASGADWKAIVKKFGQEHDPSIRTAVAGQRPVFFITLLKAGLAFEASLLTEPDSSEVPVWSVQHVTQPGKTRTKLETAIIDCLDTRPRQWDVAYLLDMIASYSDIKKTPCVKCNNMTDAAAQLPAIRKPVRTHGPDGQQTTLWEAYHPACA